MMTGEGEVTAEETVGVVDDAGVVEDAGVEEAGGGAADDETAREEDVDTRERVTIATGAPVVTATAAVVLVLVLGRERNLGFATGSARFPPRNPAKAFTSSTSSCRISSTFPSILFPKPRICSEYEIPEFHSRESESVDSHARRPRPAPGASGIPLAIASSPWPNLRCVLAIRR